MTAHSPSSVAESISSTIDPDAQARRTNDGELSAGFQSDLTVDEDAVDGLLTAEELAAEFDENLNDGKLYAKYRRLAAEQAALRRLATLVARGVEPLEVFGAVAEEMLPMPARGRTDPADPDVQFGAAPEQVTTERLELCEQFPRRASPIVHTELSDFLTEMVTALAVSAGSSTPWA
jgi:hypothetical protein